MSNNLRKTIFFIKHILSVEWISALLLKEDEDTLTFLITDVDTYFEENDKILYAIQHENTKSVYNSIVTNVDFIDINKVSVTIHKAVERRHANRYSINLPANITTDLFMFSTEILDLSSKGFKISTDKELLLRDEITITIDISDSDILTCKCFVVYKNPSDNLDKFFYGLKICKISYENKRLLGEFISTLK